MFTLRAATREDLAAIRALIFAVRINPMGLDWKRFLVAVDDHEVLIGCGQVKIHQDGSLELASIAVVQAWRGNGVARALIEHLLDLNPRPLYLTCRAKLGPFYERFGFRVVEEKAMPRQEMPRYFQRITRLARLVGATGIMPRDLLVMICDA